MICHIKSAMAPAPQAVTKAARWSGVRDSVVVGLVTAATCMVPQD